MYHNRYFDEDAYLEDGTYLDDDSKRRRRRNIAIGGTAIAGGTILGGKMIYDRIKKNRKIASQIQQDSDRIKVAINSSDNPYTEINNEDYMFLLGYYDAINENIY